MHRQISILDRDKCILEKHENCLSVGFLIHQGSIYPSSSMNFAKAGLSLRWLSSFGSNMQLRSPTNIKGIPGLSSWYDSRARKTMELNGRGIYTEARINVN